MHPGPRCYDVEANKRMRLKALMKEPVILQCVKPLHRLPDLCQETMDKMLSAADLGARVALDVDAKGPESGFHRTLTKQYRCGRPRSVTGKLLRRGSLLS